MRTSRTFHAVFWLLFVAILVIRSGTAHAEPTPNREVTKAWAEYYIENREFKEAIRQLKAHLATDPDDPEALRMLGVTYRMTGDWTGAEKALARAAAMVSGLERGAALYLVADSQLHSGLVSRAKQTLADVATIPGLRASAAEASARATAGMTLPPLVIDRSEAEGLAGLAPKPWNLSVSLASAYDSNVLLLPDSQTAGLNPATSMITTGVSGDYSTKVRGVDLTGNLSASYSRNFNQAASSFDNIPISAGLEWVVPGKWAAAHDLAFTQQGSATFVNTDGMGLFSTSAGAGLKGTLFNAGGHALELSFPVTHNWYPGVPVTSPAEDRTGFAIAPSLTHRHAVFDLPFNQSVSYSHQFAKGPNYVSTVYNASAGVSFSLPSQVGANLSLAASRSGYPNNPSGRSETKWNTGLEFNRKFAAFVPLNTSLSYGMENNVSTIQDAKYLKHSATLKVTYEVQ